MNQAIQFPAVKLAQNDFDTFFDPPTIPQNRNSPTLTRLNQEFGERVRARQGEMKSAGEMALNQLSFYSRLPLTQVIESLTINSPKPGEFVKLSDLRELWHKTAVGSEARVNPNNANNNQSATILILKVMFELNGKSFKIEEVNGQKGFYFPQEADNKQLPSFEQKGQRFA